MDGPAFSALSVLMLVWGYNWVVMKIALRYAAPFDFAALRTFFASLLLLLPVLIWQRRALVPRRILPILVLGFLQTACFVGLVNTALVHGGAGKSSVLVYTMPFWVALLAPLVLLATTAMLLTAPSESGNQLIRPPVVRESFAIPENELNSL